MDMDVFITFVDQLKHTNPYANLDHLEQDVIHLKV